VTTQREQYCRRRARWCRERAAETGGVLRTIARQLAELWEQVADREQRRQNPEGSKA